MAPGALEGEGCFPDPSALDTCHSSFFATTTRALHACMFVCILTLHTHSSAFLLFLAYYNHVVDVPVGRHETHTNDAVFRLL